MDMSSHAFPTGSSQSVRLSGADELVTVSRRVPSDTGAANITGPFRNAGLSIAVAVHD